jgi:GT2 family glycosyltransferase
MMVDPIDVSVCLINHATTGYTLNCLRSLYANTHAALLEVVLVENASPDDSARIIQQEFPQVQLLLNRTPQTFTVNSNLAIHHSTGRYVLVLNNDTVVHDEAVDLLVRFMDQHPECGAVSAKLQQADGLAQPILIKTPTLGWYVWEIMVVQNLTVVSTAFRRYFARKSDFCANTEVQNLCGACMLVRRAVIDQVGIFDEQYNFYAEDADWSYRINRAGWRMYIVADACITHYGDVSLGRVRARAKIEEYRSIRRFFAKHQLGGTATPLILKGSWLLVAMLRLLGYMLLAALKRTEAKQSVVAYRRILAWHLTPWRRNRLELAL